MYNSPDMKIKKAPQNYVLVKFRKLKSMLLEVFFAGIQVKRINQREFRNNRKTILKKKKKRNAALPVRIAIAG